MRKSESLKGFDERKQHWISGIFVPNWRTEKFIESSQNTVWFHLQDHAMIHVFLMDTNSPDKDFHFIGSDIRRTKFPRRSKCQD
jgi:hypothetical protein